MALASYNDLIAAIADWAKRSDLGARMPDFVRLAELRIKSRLHPRMLEQTIDLPGLAGETAIAFPAGMQEPLALWRIDASNWLEMEQINVRDLPLSNLPVRPYYFGIDGENIRFPAPLDQNYEFKLRFSPLYALSPSLQTNPILTAYPDTYLYGALLEYAIWARDDNGGGMWSGRFEEAIKRANRQEARANRNVQLTSDIPAVMRRTFDIYRGY